jgi:hypothetical protein
MCSGRKIYTRWPVDLGLYHLDVLSTFEFGVCVAVVSRHSELPDICSGEAYPRLVHRSAKLE